MIPKGLYHRVHREAQKDEANLGLDFGSVSLRYPTSSLQFSSVFFTSAMNWSATAPSIRR